MRIPYTLDEFKCGNENALEWARSVSEEELNKLTKTVTGDINAYSWSLYEVISRIKNGSFISIQDLRTLALKAFLHGDRAAQEKFADYHNFDLDEAEGVDDAASIAYWIYLQSYPASGLSLAYAALAGLTVEQAREICDDPEIETLWFYSNYNDDKDLVFKEMIDALLYEDERETKWKRAPHTILRQLVAEGHTHPGIHAFLRKNNDKKWARSLQKRLIIRNTINNIGCLVGFIIVYVLLLLGISAFFNVQNTFIYGGSIGIILTLALGLSLIHDTIKSHK